MTTRIPSDGEHGAPMDLTTLHEDDLLLDQLGRGEEPMNGGTVAATLSQWRAALPEAGPPDDRLLAAAVAAVRRARPTGRWVRGSTIAATALVLAFGAVTAAAEHAGPGSPLWPVTQLLFHDQAEARSAVDAAALTIAEARAAIDDGRFGQAARLLDDAAVLVERIDDRATAQRLSAEIAALRARLPVHTGEIGVQDVRPPSSAVPRPPAAPLPTDPQPPPTSAPPAETGTSPVPGPIPTPPNIIDVPSMPLIPEIPILPLPDISITVVIPPLG